MSVRYGLQLCSRVQIGVEERKCALMKTLQLTQNRLLRTLNKTKVADKVSIQSMLDKFKLPSVNRLAAEIKLVEVWKSLYVENCPIVMDPYNQNLNQSIHQLRTRHNRVFNDSAKLMPSQSSFNVDAARVWNNAPQEVRGAKTLREAKTFIKKYCGSLPL